MNALELAVVNYMPPEYIPALRKALRAQTPDAAKVARAQHAGRTKSERKRAAINAGVEQYRLQLVNWTGTDTARAIWLTRRIYPDGETDKAGRPCGWRTVYNHLKTLSI
jgi:hypothetical protein